MFIISTPLRDHKNTSVNINGWQLDRYETNPIVEWSVPPLFGFDDPDRVIGISAVWIETNKLYAEWFPDPNSELAIKLDKKLKQPGASLGASVNFLEIEGRYGIGDERKGGDNETYYYMKQELLSWKLCFIPANSECVYQRALSTDKREHQLTKVRMASFLNRCKPKH